MKLLPLDLAGMLEFGGFIHPGAQDDDDMMCRIGYFCDLINSHTGRPEQSGAPADSRADSLIHPITPSSPPSSTVSTSTIGASGAPGGEL